MTGRLKVCEIASVDSVMKWFVLPLIDEMVRRGWDVTGVCAPGDEVAGLRGRGYSITTVPISRTFNVISHAKSVIELVSLFRKEKFDLVHVHTPIGALVGRLAASIAGVPRVIYTAHGFYFHDEMTPIKRWAHIGLEWALGRITDFLFTVSEEDARDAVRLGIMPAHQTMAAGNGVSPLRFNVELPGRRPEIRRSLRIPEDAYVVGFVGRMVREKGVVDLLEAIKLLRSDQPVEIFLLLVGDRLPSDHDDDIDRELRDGALSLGNKLVRTGSSDDVPGMLAAMDVFCLPSYREGLPMTILEAMMMRLPVVATRIRGCREAVIDGVTGILVRPGDIDGLAAAFGKLIDNPDLSSRMGIEGRSRALALYDLEKVINRQVDRIEDLLLPRANQ